MPNYNYSIHRNHTLIIDQLQNLNLCGHYALVYYTIFEAHAQS